ncbi:enolase-like [Olea europaea var. sylvestris]|uniref:enolase-like n=1 Tax=Olea europaea var. sylvestris TaxID=158386 RepID=UPI000C1D667A|nr:enolase-like [Olea europaea var. sylvestris]
MNEVFFFSFNLLLSFFFCLLQLESLFVPPLTSPLFDEVVSKSEELDRLRLVSENFGNYEALESRDRGSDYLGKGVSKAVNNVNTIIGPVLIGKQVRTDHTGIDNFIFQQLDRT